jgi:hypothetical protein
MNQLYPTPAFNKAYPFNANNQLLNNTLNNSTLQKQVNNAKEDKLKQMKLGSILPYHKYDYYEQTYGHGYKKPFKPTYNRPPAAEPSRPLPFLLNTTRNKEVLITRNNYVKNKDIPYEKTKKYGTW